MSDTPLKELDPRVRKQVEKAMENSRKGNPRVAIDIFIGLLEKFPGCVEIRQALRDAQRLANAGKKKSFLSGISMFKLQALAKKSPGDRMKAAETALSSDPANIDAHKTIARAAVAMDLPHAAVFAHECIRSINGGDTDNLKALAEAYLKVGRVEDAVKAADAALQVNPADGDAQEIVKRASVQQSMERGKWEEKGDFRTKLKDAEEAVRLEQAHRVQSDEKNLSELIAEATRQVESDPDNVNLYKKIAGFYHQLKEYETAAEWVRKAQATDIGKADTSLDRLYTRYRSEGLASRIEELETQLKANPDDTSLQEQVEAAIQDRDNFELENAAQVVERHPNDYGARFNLGNLLLKAGRVDEAIQHLQIANRNPKVRLQSLISLGLAYRAKNFNDLAAEQFATAKGEIPIMNTQKKEATYELGLAYEAQGDDVKAIAEFKEVYAADVTFRDVAAKIDAFYSRG